MTQTTYDETKHPRAVDGKFATKPASEAAVSLQIDGTPITAEQAQLLAAVHADPYGDEEWVEDGVEENTERTGSMQPLQYGGIDEYADAKWVADQLRSNGQAEDLHFEFTYDPGGTEVTGYEVGVVLSDGTRLVAGRDTRDLTATPEAEGDLAALGYAESIMGDYQLMRDKAIDAGLLSDSYNHPGPDAALHTRIDSALRELDPDEGTWPTGDQVDAIVAATQRQMDDDQGDFAGSRADELSVGDKFIHEGELHRVASTDGDHKSLTVETDAGEFLELKNDEQVLVQGVYRCQGCGRPEAACSADPCVDVLADREA